jgi:hypothetical protein
MGSSPVNTLGLIKAVIVNLRSRAQKYHDRTHLPLMVSLVFALQRAENTMKNTIDDADHIINMIYLIVIIQYLINYAHSHSIVNKPFLLFIFNDLFSC